MGLHGSTADPRASSLGTDKDGDAAGNTNSESMRWLTIIYAKEPYNFRTIQNTILQQCQVIRQIQLDETGKPSPSVKEEEAAATRQPPADKLSDLKKQSQFAAAHLGAKPLIKGDYNNMPAIGDEENKANQSQSQPPLREREKAGAGNVAGFK